MSSIANMPQYQCHKKVRALEIDRLEENDHGGVTMHFTDEGFPPRENAESLFPRREPVKGDFYVVYDDGYESVSPRQAFLDGYSRI